MIDSTYMIKATLIKKKRTLVSIVVFFHHRTAAKMVRFAKYTKVGSSFKNHFHLGNKNLVKNLTPVFASVSGDRMPHDTLTIFRSIGTASIELASRKVVDGGDGMENGTE